MYLRGSLNTKTIQSAIQIPIDLLTNQNQVYVVNDGRLALRTIEVISTTADHAIIKGLSDDVLLLSEKIVGAYEGLPVSPMESTASVN